MNLISTAVCVKNTAHAQSLLQTLRQNNALKSPFLLLCVCDPDIPIAEKTQEICGLERIARANEAELTVLFARNAATAAAAYLRQQATKQVFAGMPYCEEHGFVRTLRKLLPQLRVCSMRTEPAYYYMCSVYTPAQKNLAI